MNASTERPRRPAALHSAARLQQQLLRFGLHGTLFLCGLCAWIFKLKGDGSAEGGILPYSPLQVLIPLLGAGSLLWLVSLSGGLPRLTVGTLSTRCLQIGIGLIVLGAAVHLRGDGRKEAALYIVRWLLPVAFLLFFAITRLYGASPLALLLGLAGGAVVTALSVEAVRQAGMGLPISDPIAGRYGGYLNHPNQYGILCSVTVPILLYFHHSRDRLLRVASVLLLPVYLLCLFQNLSKTNILLFFLALLAGALALSLKNPRKLLGTLGLTAGLAVFLALSAGLAMSTLHDYSPKAAKTIEDALLNPTEARSVDSREEIWDTALRIIRERPLVGLGPGKSLDALGIAHAHNMVLQAYLDAGFAGFAGMWFVVLGVLWRFAELLRAELRSREEMSDERMLRMLSGLALVIYLCANSMSDSFSTATMPAFMFFAVIAFAAEPADALAGRISRVPTRGLAPGRMSRLPAAPPKNRDAA